MRADSYEIRQCSNCGLRYPIIANHPFGPRCPSCLGETQIVLKRMMASALKMKQRGGDNQGKISAILDNIRSAWNVGAIFRTADGLGVNKLYLCGITPTPENESVHKTSLGAEESLTWEYAPNALEMAKKLKIEGYRLIALEQDKRAIQIGAISFAVPDERIVVVVGNEVTGVDPEILDLCDKIIYIPMRGQKKSFNVEVAFGIAVHTLSEKQTNKVID